jgi:hypothetical protein
VEYANVPPSIAAVVSSKLATLHALETDYGVEGMWDLLEISTVDNHNANIHNSGS